LARETRRGAATRRQGPSLPVPRTAPAYRPGRGGAAEAQARWLWGGVSVFAAAVVAIAAWATASHPKPPTPVPPTTGPIDGIACDSGGQTAQQVNAHLDIFIGGQPMTIPAYTGFINTPSGGCQYWLHTTADSKGNPDGIIRVAAPSTATFTLGQFFDIWGLPLSSTDLAGHQAAGGQSVKAYVNGQPYTGDPRAIPLRSHDEIVLEYGPPWKTPVPSTFAFPAGS
jgi:hypothetical protein